MPSAHGSESTAVSAPAVARQRLPADQPRRREARRRRRRRAVGDGPEHQRAPPACCSNEDKSQTRRRRAKVGINLQKDIGRISRVVLELLVAPAVGAVSQLGLPVVRHRPAGQEGRLPVDGSSPSYGGCAPALEDPPASSVNLSHSALSRRKWSCRGMLSVCMYRRKHMPSLFCLVMEYSG